jgi:hypothetical protein
MNDGSAKFDRIAPTDFMMGMRNAKFDEARSN